MFLLLAAVGCRRESPALENYAVTYEVQPENGKPGEPPPDPALGPWRVWINQERPRQKKAPEWTPVPAKEARLLELAPDGHWRCGVNGVRLLGKTGESGSIELWQATRALRCSTDGFRTHVDAVVHATFDDSGKQLAADPRSVIYLNDVVDGVPRVTVVGLEAVGLAGKH